MSKKNVQCTLARPVFIPHHHRLWLNYTFFQLLYYYINIHTMLPKVFLVYYQMAVRNRSFLTLLIIIWSMVTFVFITFIISDSTLEPVSLLGECYLWLSTQVILGTYSIHMNRKIIWYLSSELSASCKTDFFRMFNWLDPIWRQMLQTFRKCTCFSRRRSYM